MSASPSKPASDIPDDPETGQPTTEEHELPPAAGDEDDASDVVATEGDADPRYTLIVIGDDGKLYKLTKEVWQKHEMKQPVAMGIAQQLKQFGAYLAYIPEDLAIGIGQFCTLINLDAILRNQPSSVRAAASGNDGNGSGS